MSRDDVEPSWTELWAFRRGDSLLSSPAMSGFRLFSFGDIPVFVSPFYLLLLFFFGYRQADPTIGILFGVTVTLSLLVHELGHALVARRFKLQPQILLHGFGGLTSHQPAERDRDDALIVAAGPLSGLALGALALAASEFVPQWMGAGPPRVMVSELLRQLVWVNFFWSFINLLPIWPLDGGQLTRLGMLKLAKPGTAEKVVHGLSVALLLIAGFFMLRAQSIFLILIIGLLLFENVQVLRGERSSGPVRKGTKRARQLLEEAEAAFRAGDFAEAARIGHHVRDESVVPREILPKLWTLLGVSEARVGRYDGALTYLNRAPLRADVLEAKIEALHMLDRDHELDALLESQDFTRLPPERRMEILRVVRPEWVGGARPSAE
jgi:stage IV sporulation protein FB